MIATNKDIHTPLSDIFGFDKFLPGQEDVICRIVEGKSCLAVFPTGQGKSLCYQLSALLLPGLTLVVSPLVALMKDQVDFLKSKSIKAARLDSSLSSAEFNQIQNSLSRNELKLLYVAPERFANERFILSLRRLNISMMVVDEVHCISEWGHNFRPDYLKLADIIKNLRIPQILGLTATATPKVAADIKTAFSIPEEDFILTGFYRPNLTLRFSPSADPLALLLKRLASRPRDPAIVYVTLQATAEYVATALAEAGYSSRAYHAGLKDEQRHEVQDWFMAANDAVVVATIAFGMGIDKAGIRYVYHYNLAKSLENYAQEIGRAGRDGKPAICETLGGGQDLTVLENFVYGDTPEPAAVQRLLGDICQEKEYFSISLYHMSHTYDIRNLVVSTLLTYLELEGLIVSTGPFYTNYKFIPQRSSAEILADYSPEKALFLRTVFSCASKGKTWFSLDLDEVITKTGAERKRVVAALNYLEEKGDLVLQVAGARRGYRLVRTLSPVELAQLTERLVSRFFDREKNDIRRIQQVVALVNHPGCQTNFLLDYFGEHRQENCGHCEWCIQGDDDDCHSARNTISTATSPVHLEKWKGQVEKVLSEKNEALQSPRQQARFFCGIRSPKSIKAGLPGRASFGLLADCSFVGILEALEKEFNSN
nr:RecQ family ATP-dependent DNA helicase [Desulfobulbaceae bacterium]